MFEVNSDGFCFSCDYPDEEWRKLFITEYLRKSQELTTTFEFDEDGVDSVNHVMMEADFFICHWIMFVLSMSSKEDENSYWLTISKELSEGWLVSFDHTVQHELNNLIPVILRTR